LNNEGRLKIANLPIITIVRNPYSWLVSVYENFYLNKIPTFTPFNISNADLTAFEMLKGVKNLYYALIKIKILNFLENYYKRNI